MNKFNAYMKLIRLPGLGGLAIPPVFGAISVGIYDFYKLAILFVIGCFTAIFGFVLNDYADVELDSLVKELHGKPLVSGIIERKNAVAICILCVLFSFFLAFYLWKGQFFDELKFSALVSLFIAGILGTIYNLYGKKIAGSDFLVAISMSLVFLFGALAFACPTLLTWIIFLLTFNQTLHMNAVEGGIKDADHDFIMGVKNIALTAGVKVDGNKISIPWHFKAFGMAIRLFSACLIFTPFIYGLNYYIWQLILLFLLIAVVILIEARLLWLEEFDRARIRKLIASAAFTRYSIVPIMLISKIGLIAFALVALPIAWYVAFTPLTGVKLFQPEM
ncbi:MAG: hypothetical protein DRN29_02745 [Thermoplasmata archaeon]|nr:MAG: hypothetical protein DRN29_02745 [Thermoplasmata archaeon]